MKSVGKWLKKHKKLCIFLVIVLILGVLIGKFVSSVQKAAQTMMTMLTQQETAVIERRSLVESVSATGSVTRFSCPTTPTWIWRRIWPTRSLL